jgi:transcriptional antiterminator NusG
MDMSDKAYHAITSINRVTGFLGPQGKPVPMRDEEVNRILNQVEEGAERPRSIISFETGETVNVTDGPFEGFSGMVEDVDQGNARLKVSVSIFGRATPVELEFTQVSKAS